MVRREVLAVGLSAALIPHLAKAAEQTSIPSPDQELKVRVKGGNLYVRVNGKLKARNHPLILVHGGPGGALWQHLPALPLAKDRAIILYDQLDSGRSDAPGDPANWTLERFASEISAIVEGLDIREHHVLGHSWGGQIATHYGAAQPKGLQSLVLQGTPTSARRAEESVRSLLLQLPDGAGNTIITAESTGNLNDPGYQKALPLFARKYIFRTNMNDVAQAYTADLPPERGVALSEAMNGPTQTRFTGKLKNFNDEPLLSRIVAPTLLLCGEFDLMTPEATRQVLPMLRRGSLEVIAGAGHMAQFDRPEDWRRVVEHHIAAHDR
jgi:proline-specific peptidase